MFFLAQGFCKEIARANVEARTDAEKGSSNLAVETAVQTVRYVIRYNVGFGDLLLKTCHRLTFSKTVGFSVSFYVY